MINTAEERYGISFEDYKRTHNPIGSDGKPLEIGVTEKGGVIYFKCPDFLDKTKIGVFPICDSFLDYSDIGDGIDLGGGIFSRTQGMPKAVLDLTGDMADWINKIKVPNTNKRGSRYSRIAQIPASYSIKDENDLLLTLDTMRTFIADKEKQFNLPAGFMIRDYLLTYRILKHRGMEINGVHVLRGLVGKDVIYAWLGFRVGERIYAPFMWTTREEELQKTYKPAIAAHIAMTLNCKDKGMISVDYGNYYDYKKILAFDTVWVNGIQYI